MKENMTIKVEVTVNNLEQLRVRSINEEINTSEIKLPATYTLIWNKRQAKHTMSWETSVQYLIYI